MSAFQQRKKAVLVREANERVYGDQPPSRKLPAIWAFETLEQAQAFRDRRHHEARQRTEEVDDAPCYEIEEIDVPIEAAPIKRKVYVVQRLDWQYNDNWHDLANDEPIKAFRDRELAEIYRLELEEGARRRDFNPCDYGGGGLELVTSLTEEQLTDRLLQLGVPLPPRVDQGGTSCLDFWGDDWWRHVGARLSGLQLYEVWRLFDKVRFFEVVEVEVDQ